MKNNKYLEQAQLGDTMKVLQKISYAWKQFLAGLLNIGVLWSLLLPFMGIYVHGDIVSGLIDIRGGFMWCIHPIGFVVILVPIVLLVVILLPGSGTWKRNIFGLSVAVNVIGGTYAFLICREWLMKISTESIEYDIPVIILNITLMAISEIVTVECLLAEGNAEIKKG